MNINVTVIYWVQKMTLLEPEEYNVYTSQTYQENVQSCIHLRLPIICRMFHRNTDYDGSQQQAASLK